MRRDELLPSIISFQVHERPIIEPRALQVSIGKRKPQRTDQMKTNFGGCGQSCDGTGILRNLRPHQDDVEDRLGLRRARIIFVG